MENEVLPIVCENTSGPTSLLELLGQDFSALFASQIIPAVLVDCNFCIRSISQMTYTPFGVTSSDVGRCITDIQMDLGLDLKPLLMDVVHNGVSVEHEIEYQHGCWYRLQIVPHKTLDDRIDGAILVLVSIDEIRRVKQELIDAVELTTSIIETVQEPVLVLNSEFRIVMANRSFYATFDAQPESTIDQPLYSIGCGQWNKPDLRVLLDDVLPSHNDFLNHPIDFELPGSGRKTFMASGRYCDQGAAPLLLLSLADVTKLKKTEAALIKAEKLSMASSLAASIAHEINNPLEAITNLLYLASIGDDAEAAKGYATEALQEIAHVVEITQQTLKYYRQPTVPSLTQINAVLDSLLVLYKGKLREKGIVVALQYIEAPPVMCLEGDLRQILANIVANSVDALPPGGKLTMRVHKSRDWRNPFVAGVRATISDSGSGMSAETQLKIYEAFFTTKSSAGTGLGMWISAQLVSRLCGDLRMRSSTNPGRSGTTFSLFMPFDRRRRAPDPQPAVPKIIDSQI
jgi:two-component system CheB/CheR fusion protein